jgi:adenosylhomocysteinase
MSEVLDPSLAAQGTRKIDWAAEHAPVLRRIRDQLRDDGSVKDRRIGVVLALEPKTALLARTLAEAGAEVRLACAAIMTHDDVAAGLAAAGVEVFARSDATEADDVRFQGEVLAGRPEVLIDDMAELIRMAHTTRREALTDLTGASEETTSGITLLRAMDRDGALEVPCIAANNARCKYLFDNRYGSGQSVMMALLDATNLLLAGATVLVVGYGWVGRGIARTARGLGAQVVVAEVDPFAALEAHHDGYAVAPVAEACEAADFVVTATGCRHALPVDAVARCRDGAVLANGGGPPDEIDLDGLAARARIVRPARASIDEYELEAGRSVFVVGQGRCVNLSAGEGHPIEIMDLTFAVQALAARHLARHASEMPAGLHELPSAIDEEIARHKLADLGLRIDALTRAQQQFLASWDVPA